jgi:hypothetical protein
MTIVDFYKEVSTLLELYRTGMPDDLALRKLRLLNAKALESGIENQVSEDILSRVRIFDEECSYDEDEAISFDDESEEDI